MITHPSCIAAALFALAFPSTGCSDPSPTPSPTPSGEEQSENGEGEPSTATSTEPAPTEPSTEPPSASPEEPSALTIANAPPPCSEEPSFQELPLPASLRAVKNNATVGLIQIGAGGDISVSAAENADALALRELESLIARARSTGEVVYRYLERPDRGGGGGENCLGTTAVDSPGFAMAFTYYLRSYDFRWYWDPAYR